jgi:hypothetical protein
MFNRLRELEKAKNNSAIFILNFINRPTDEQQTQGTDSL